MFTIEKATARDFEKVYPQLRQSFGDSISKEEWKKIFVPRWESPENFCGFMLLKNGKVQGYLGLIFSSRILNHKVEKFCNMTSWCVSEDCRGQSLSMLLAALKLENYTFTNFSASPVVAALLKRLGFTEFALHQQVLFPLPRLGRRVWFCEFDSTKIRDRLSANDRTVFDDHQELNCAQVLLRSGAEYSYVVLKKTWRKGMPFAKVHYVSHAENYVAGIESSMAKICLRLKVFGVMTDERYLAGHRFRTGVRYPHQRRGYFKSTSVLDAHQIDTLYSEMVVLHS